MGKVTIKDIAREAGVSISTVSNALNGVSVVKPETRDYILGVADRLNYIPDFNGRNLKAKSTKVLGLFVTSLKGPYFATLADIMFWECVKHGYELTIFITWNERSAINSILGKRVDGCVILSSDVDDEGAKRILELEYPTVFIDRELKSEKVSSIIFDSYRDGVTVAEHFIRKGVKKPMLITGVRGNYDSKERSRGFLERLEKEGIVIPDDYILDGEFNTDETYEVMNKFLQTGKPLPEAIFGTNDLSAIGAINALKDNGYSVPGDVIVMGVDDIDMCEYLNPTLSTIRTGFEKQGSLAVKKLVKMINGEETGDIYKLHGQLVERESTNKDYNKL
ncbi:MAG: LacI family DNA-binding transcriptional regulator [Lachnospiraceae bacterium]|nr:LacI family DNA-binding transcriptional regulator [Lachnospiraceae bacterium]